MRIFALSDLHIDYDVNKKWLRALSTSDYQDDVLILAGDVSDSSTLFAWCITALSGRFKKVLYVPGNHDLWVARDTVVLDSSHSLDKFHVLKAVIENAGASMQPYHVGKLSIVPLLSWYDYSFGEPSQELLNSWMDYHACRWPKHFDAHQITAYFLRENEAFLGIKNNTVISFSHFLPRIDVMPSFIPLSRRYIYPVLGTALLETQIRQINSAIHVYGHSHVNQNIVLDGTRYINNAFGYPQESKIAAKQLLCIYEH